MSCKIYNLAGGSSLRGCKDSEDSKRKLLAVVYFKDNQGHEKGYKTSTEATEDLTILDLLGGWCFMLVQQNSSKEPTSNLGYWLVFVCFLWLFDFIPWDSSPLKLRYHLGNIFLGPCFRKAPFEVCNNCPLWKNGLLSWSSAAHKQRMWDFGTSALRISCNICGMHLSSQ